MQITVLGHTKERRNGRTERIRVIGPQLPGKDPIRSPIKGEICMYKIESAILPYILNPICNAFDLRPFSKVIV